MVYEIPREVFKQKLLNRSNVCILQVTSSGSQPEAPYKEVKMLQLPIQIDDFCKSYTNKQMTYLIYGFDQISAEAKSAADAVYAAGYPFVFYYKGNFAEDKVLDKGIN